MISLRQPQGKLVAVFAAAFFGLIMIATQADARQNSQTPETFVEGLVDRTINVLADTGQPSAAKVASLELILTDYFDLERIGRLALGRHYKVAADEDRNDYHNLFGDYLIAVYADRLNRAFADHGSNGITFEVVDVKAARKDQIVSTRFEAGGTQFALDWRLRDIDGEWRVLDMVVEGISMVVTQRNEFSSIVGGGRGLASLNQHLRAKIEANQKVVLVSQ